MNKKVGPSKIPNKNTATDIIVFNLIVFSFNRDSSNR